MPRREDHEVRQGYVGHWIKKKKTLVETKLATRRKSCSIALNFLPFSDLSLPTHFKSYSLRFGHSSILPALNLQPAATREPDGLCGNQRYRREFLMMGIMVPETC